MSEMHHEIERPGSLSSVEKSVVDWVQESAHSAYEHLHSAVHNPYAQAGALMSVCAVATVAFNREALFGAAEKFLPEAGGILTHNEPIAIARDVAAHDALAPTGTRLGADGLPRQLPGAHQMKLDAPPPLSPEMTPAQLHELSIQTPVVDDMHYGKMQPSKRALGIWQMNIEGVANHANRRAIRWIC